MGRRLGLVPPPLPPLPVDGDVVSRTVGVCDCAEVGISVGLKEGVLVGKGVGM